MQRLTILEMNHLPVLAEFPSTSWFVEIVRERGDEEDPGPDN